jgi:uncharacterized phage-associated protein
MSDPDPILELMFEKRGRMEIRLTSRDRAIYHDLMTVTAQDVAAVLCERLPDLPTLKKHKLLYYCQAHHLAAFGEPLFPDKISAWDHGPVVGWLWHTEKNHELEPRDVELGEAQLNTIGYVLSRYGGLTGSDLETLTHGEMPWQRADEHRRPGGSARIEHGWMRDFYREGGAQERDSSTIVLDSDEVSDWLANAGERRHRDLEVDDLEQLRALTGRG